MEFYNLNGTSGSACDRDDFPLDSCGFDNCDYVDDRDSCSWDSDDCRDYCDCDDCDCDNCDNDD